MANHDEYDKNILRALLKIGKHLESIDKKMAVIQKEKISKEECEKGE